MQSLLKSSASMGNNKNSQIEFPTSPQPTIGEEITHYTHSKHPLIKVNLPELFTCTGCKEYGSGKRFACQQCDFQLHEFCALSPPQLQNHPLHGQHQLVFHAKPKQAKAGIAWPKCDVCNKSTKGFIFRCRACSFQMHPCCAKLSTEIYFPDVHPHTLKLLPPSKTSSSGNDTGILCDECKKTRSGRVYRCTVCDYHLHAVCAKALINGLRENGIPTPEKPSMIGKTSRLVSQVVIEFIGGLIEGFGEGVGEYLVQNIARGRCISSSRRSKNA
ncbi:Cysteine/Histidine-rich C1 domain family protein [Forsythia ovata]|uniref:Cysteine/Histidine-rich C1 domain family protein n=1 Tax=Forsythia ovata TaxID=205694 RepID=A0ABD1UXV9_9LAMI